MLFWFVYLSFKDVNSTWLSPGEIVRPSNGDRVLNIRPECTVNPRTGGSHWFQPPSLNQEKRGFSLHAAFVIRVTG